MAPLASYRLLIFYVSFFVISLFFLSVLRRNDLNLSLLDELDSNAQGAIVFLLQVLFQVLAVVFFDVWNNVEFCT